MHTCFQCYQQLPYSTMLFTALLTAHENLKYVARRRSSCKAFESCLLSNEKYQFKLNLGSLCLLLIPVAWKLARNMKGIPFFLYMGKLLFGTSVMQFGILVFNACS